MKSKALILGQIRSVEDELEPLEQSRGTLLNALRDWDGKHGHRLTHLQQEKADLFRELEEISCPSRYRGEERKKLRGLQCDRLKDHPDPCGAMARAGERFEWTGDGTDR